MGLRLETLEKYVELARPILIKVAKGQRGDRLITYGQLMEEMGGPGRGYIGEVLEAVSDREYGNSRTILSALVVGKDKSRPKDKWRPNKGWWELRILPPSLRNASIEEKMERWRQEYGKACEYWEKHDA